MTELIKKRCRPCEGESDKLTSAQTALLLPLVPGWQLDGETLKRRFTLRDFKAAVAMLNAVATIAESEGHHPDFSVHYNQIDFAIQTHAVHGLTENDFILAAKISETQRAHP
jgi:4a-hydroxytetrahydrobiopterin dehydratase